jgi:hypothetical protein
MFLGAIASLRISKISPDLLCKITSGKPRSPSVLQKLNNEKGYNHLTVNHSVNFKDPETGAHSNTIKSTWRHAKVTLPNYKRKKNSMEGTWQSKCS